MFVQQTYTVVATVQSKDNDPVEIKYATRTNEIGAAHAVTSVLSMYSEDSGSQFNPRLLSVRIECSAKV